MRPVCGGSLTGHVCDRGRSGCSGYNLPCLKYPRASGLVAVLMEPAAAACRQRGRRAAPEPRPHGRLGAVARTRASPSHATWAVVPVGAVHPAQGAASFHGQAKSAFRGKAAGFGFRMVERGGPELTSSRGTETATTCRTSVSAARGPAEQTSHNCRCKVGATSKRVGGLGTKPGRVLPAPRPLQWLTSGRDVMAAAVTPPERRGRAPAA